jgi:nicotinamide-nucleotide amidase
MESTKLNKCVEVLKSKKWTIAFAEGASEGKVCYEFAELPAADSILLGGMVAMKDHMKDYFFGIKPEVLDKYGSESPEVAQLMAHHLCKYLKADVSISVTIANQCNNQVDDQTALHSVFIHLLFPDETLSKQYDFTGTKAQVAEQTVDTIAQLIIDKVAVPV